METINYKELNEILGDTLREVRAGTVSDSIAKNTARLAQGLNKNNSNAISHKKLTNDPGKLPFFE